VQKSPDKGFEEHLLFFGPREEKVLVRADVPCSFLVFLLRDWPPSQPFPALMFSFPTLLLAYFLSPTIPEMLRLRGKLKRRSACKPNRPHLVLRQLPSPSLLSSSSTTSSSSLVQSTQIISSLQPLANRMEGLD
jgi:hypothetical protein